MNSLTLDEVIDRLTELRNYVTPGTALTNIRAIESRVVSNGRVVVFHGGTADEELMQEVEDLRETVDDLRENIADARDQLAELRHQLS